MKQREEIFCAIPWYYSITKEESITVRYVIGMKDEIDGKALKKAVDATMERYPYLGKRLVICKDRYCLESNDLPVTVHHTPKPVPLCGPTANYHQFAISYFEKKIFFNNTHAIFDGRGRGPVLHTLMYFYCKFRYNEEVDMPGVWLPGTPIDPREYEDPYKKEFDNTSFVWEFPTAEDILKLGTAGLVTRGEGHIHRIRINEKQLMALCKTNDATPNTAISLLMCRAIHSVHPDSVRPVVAGVYCDLRSLLDAPLTHNSLVTTLPLKFTKEMFDMPFDQQNTIFRGMMLALSDPACMMPKIKDQIKACAALAAFPTLQEKLDAAKAAMGSLFDSHTFLVSYSGKSDFGSCDKHIEALFPEPHATGIDTLIEVTSADGWFYLAYNQEWRNDVYFNAFVKQIVALGLDFDLLYSGENNPIVCEI